MSDKFDGVRAEVMVTLVSGLRVNLVNVQGEVLCAFDTKFSSKYAEELTRRWNGFAEIKAENAALKKRVEELEQYKEIIDWIEKEKPLMTPYCGAGWIIESSISIADTADSDGVTLYNKQKGSFVDAILTSINDPDCEPDHGDIQMVFENKKLRDQVKSLEARVEELETPNYFWSYDHDMGDENINNLFVALDWTANDFEIYDISQSKILGDCYVFRTEDLEDGDFKTYIFPTREEAQAALEKIKSEAGE